MQGRPAILDLDSYPSYDSVMVLAKAIDNADSTDVEKVKSEMLKISGHNGVTRTVNIVDDGSMRIIERIKVPRGIRYKTKDEWTYIPEVPALA